MRTTVTLDSDVEKMIRDAMRKYDLSFKEALNHVIRMGIQGLESGRGGKERYRLKAARLELRGDELPSHQLAAIEESGDRRVLESSS